MKKTADQMHAEQRTWQPKSTILVIDRTMGMSQVRYLDGSSEWCTDLQLSSWANRVEGEDGASAQHARSLAVAHP